MVSWTNIFSGKFIFTVITAFVFAYAVHAKILNGEQTYGIIMLIVAFYFSKPTEPIKGDSNVQTKTTIASDTVITSPDPIKG